MLNLESKLKKRIAEYNDSLQGTIDEFPDFEIPLTVQLDVDERDPQRKYHMKICSTLLKEFRTGELRQKAKTKLAKDDAVVNSFLQEERQKEFEKTIQRLLIRNGVSDINNFPCVCIFSGNPQLESLKETAKITRQF